MQKIYAAAEGTVIPPAVESSEKSGLMKESMNKPIKVFMGGRFLLETRASVTRAPVGLSLRSAPVTIGQGVTIPTGGGGSVLGRINGGRGILRQAQRGGIASFAGIIGILSLLMTHCMPAAAQSAYLTWNQSGDPTVVSYNVYYGGESGAYTNETSFGEVTNAVISGLMAGATYYFAVTAVESDGIESVFSKEVDYTVPPGSPTVAFTNLTPGMTVSTASFTVDGDTGDSEGVTNVFFSLNGGAWTNAVTTDEWNTWSASVALAPGTNYFTVYAVDELGNVSATNSLSFEYVISTALHLQMEGNGTLSPLANGPELNIGQNYSLSATPAPGFAFTNWTGGANLPLNVVTNGNVVEFTMVSNLTLSANFVDTNPVTIGGFTWVDRNDNGLADPGEAGLAGVAVALYETNLALGTATEVTNTVSDPSGMYIFTNIPPGVYEVGFLPPAGGYTFSPELAGSDTNLNSAADQTSGLSEAFTIMPGETNLSLNAGFVPAGVLDPPPLFSVAVTNGMVWITWHVFDDENILAYVVARSTPNGSPQNVTANEIAAIPGQTYTVPDPGAALPGIYTYTLYGVGSDLSLQEEASTNVQLGATLVASTGVAFTSITIAGGNALLAWNGGQPPYVVEQSVSPGADAVWQPVGPAQTVTEMSVPMTNQTGFFRVSAAGD
jgi:hypothetical protein